MRVVLLSLLAIPLTIGCGDAISDKDGDTAGSTDVGADADGTTDDGTVDDGTADSDGNADDGDDTAGADGGDAPDDGGTDTAAGDDGDADDGSSDADADDGTSDVDASPPEDTAAASTDTALPGSDSGMMIGDTATVDTASETETGLSDTGLGDTAEPVTPPPPSDLDGDGWTTADGDCHDMDSSIHPGRTEVCDGIDNNCNDEIDEGVIPTWYLDMDSDGHGSEAFTFDGCEPLDGYVASSDDCNDDSDLIFPGADEMCDAIDNNCDGVIDEDVTSTYFLDEDGDGYGDAGFTAEACEPPEGYVDNAEDCNDTDEAVSPGATEQCDGADNDCDGATDEDDAADAPTFYLDSDSDGFGDPLSTTTACEAPDGYTIDNQDCDDNDDDIHPDAAEECDEEDNNCDGLVDGSDSVDATTFYLDDDGDGFGASATSLTACDAPDAYTADATDCDDTNPDVYPGAPEVCNGIDNNCNDEIDEGVTSTFFLDSDGDGFGDALTSESGCEATEGYVADATDCDDTNPSVHPSRCGAGTA